jgi:hypothetical protein
MPRCAGGSALDRLGQRSYCIVESRRAICTGLDNVFLRSKHSEKSKEHHDGL